MTTGQAYACGCDTLGRHCPAHADWACHGGPTYRGGECPPCRRQRWLSIGNSYRPTKTRALRPETRTLEGMDGKGQ